MQNRLLFGIYTVMFVSWAQLEPTPKNTFIVLMILTFGPVFLLKENQDAE